MPFAIAVHRTTMLAVYERHFLEAIKLETQTSLVCWLYKISRYFLLIFSY